MSIIRLFSSMTAEQAASMLREDLNSFSDRSSKGPSTRPWTARLRGLETACSPNGDKIYRNGYYESVPNASYGPLSLRIPRDRVSLFKMAMLKPYQRSTRDLDIWSKGFTSRASP